MKNTLTCILTLIVAALVSSGGTPQASGQGPSTGISASDTVLMAPFEVGDYVITLPAGMLQQRQGDDFVKAFLPTGQFGVSFVIENVRPKEKELRTMCTGMATELGMSASSVEKLDLKGMKGWYCSGRVEKMIVTVAVVSHDAELLKIVLMETETLRPKGPALLSTLSLR